MSTAINTKKVPQPIGPYSQAIKINNMVITSGQIPINKNDFTNLKDIKEQTLFVLNNIKLIIEESGLKIQNIVKTTIFLTDITQLEIINDVYEKFFLKYHNIFPARSCIQVSRLPKDVNIEIEAIAILENKK